MARPRTVDRERLLDAAETVVARSSAAALTFGSLATEAGVPKASVQSAFGTREALIDAMLNRWLGREQARFDQALAGATEPRARILAHIQTTADEPPEESKRVAPLMAALVETPDRNSSSAKWYASRIGDLSADSEEARRLRIAFLAAEGTYYLRHLIGFEMSDDVWREIFDDLRNLANASG